MRRRSSEVAAIVLISGAVLLLYRKALRLWWTYDDPYLLHLSIDHAWSDSIIGVSIWREMSQRLFTPLLTLTYEGALALFELDAAQWHGFQLAVLAGSAWALYGALRQFVSIPAALAGGVLFVAGIPMCTFATQFMLIHYLEAVLLASLAVIAFAVAERRRSGWRRAVAALLYFLAALAKEIAVPLLVVFMLIAEGTWRERIRKCALHIVALVVYSLWRTIVLETPFGGYGWAIESVGWAAVLSSFPGKLAAALSGETILGGIALFLALAVGMIALNNRRRGVIAGMTLLLAIVPVLPVSVEMQRRFAIGALIWLVALFAFGYARLTEVLPRASHLLVVLTVALALVANRQEWGKEFGRSQRMSDEARFFAQAAPDVLLRRPVVPPAAMGELRWLKEQYLKRPGGAGWFYDDIYFCTQPTTGRAIREYDANQRMIVPSPDIASRFCRSIHQTATLGVRFQYRNDTLRWSFAPYEEGRYSVVIADGVQAFEVPRQGAFRLPGVPGLSLRVRYDSPQQWTTYSPPMTLDFRTDRAYEWRR